MIVVYLVPQVLCHWYDRRRRALVQMPIIHQLKTENNPFNSVILHFPGNGVFDKIEKIGFYSPSAENIQDVKFDDWNEGATVDYY